MRELQNMVELSLILKPRGPVSFDHPDHKQNRKRTAETPVEEGLYRLDDVVIAHINYGIADRIYYQLSHTCFQNLDEDF